MGIYVGGVEYDKIYAGGVELTAFAGGARLSPEAGPSSRLLASIDVTLAARNAQRSINRIQFNYPIFEWPRTSPRATLHAPSTGIYTDEDVPYALTYIGFNESARVGTTVLPYLGQIRIRGNVPEDSRPNAIISGNIQYQASDSFFASALGTVINFGSGPVIWRGMSSAPQTARISFDLYRLGADQPGTLTPRVALSGRDYRFAITLVDPDGVRGITSATLTARDGTTADITSDWVTTDANTRTHTDSRRNNRWSSGTVSVTYVDGAGNTDTLTANWSL